MRVGLMIKEQSIPQTIGPYPDPVAAILISATHQGPWSDGVLVARFDPVPRCPAAEEELGGQVNEIILGLARYDP
jgi:hypothetical protein